MKYIPPGISTISITAPPSNFSVKCRARALRLSVTFPRASLVITSNTYSDTLDGDATRTPASTGVTSFGDDGSDGGEGFAVGSGARSSNPNGMDVELGVGAGVGAGVIALGFLGFVFDLVLLFVRGLLGTITTWPETNFITRNRLMTHKVVTTVAFDLRLSSFVVYIFLVSGRH